MAHRLPQLIKKSSLAVIDKFQIETQNERMNIQEEIQVEHDKFRGVNQTICYFENDNGYPTKVVIDDAKKVSKLRSLRNNRPASLAEVGLPEEARLGRVDVTLVNTNNPEDVEVIFVGGIHADESQSPSNWEKSTSVNGEMRKLARAEIMEANDTAAMLGRRDDLIPILDEEIDELQAEDAMNIAILPKGGHLVNNEILLGLDLVTGAWTEDEREIFRNEMSDLRDENKDPIDFSNELKLQSTFLEIRDLLNSNDKGDEKERKVVEARRLFEEIKPTLKKINASKNFVISRKVNLNRQFLVEENTNAPDSSRKVMTWSGAKNLAAATADLPNAKYIFSMHEDPEFYQDKGSGEELNSNQGFYFYDVHYSSDDPDRDLVLGLKEELMLALKKEGFYILNGVDDANDPSLGFFAENGYINQPIINNENQIEDNDGTYETTMVSLGQRNILKIERAFCFEIPGKISSDRKTELLNILQEKFILPFLKAKGLF